jgi:septal ring factor EnvC (AmiA/AmiB activator)
VDADPFDATDDVRPVAASDPVDVTATPGGLPRAPRRRLRTATAVAGLVALAATGVAVQQRDVADRWRERSLALEAQRDEAIGRTEALESQLAELAGVQAATQAELTEVSDRLAALAGEKADAEDRAVVTAAERDAVRRVAQQVATAVNGLDACILALLEVRASSVDAFNRLARGETVDVAPLNAQSAATIDQCNAARRAAAAAGTAAGALG